MKESLIFSLPHDKLLTATLATKLKIEIGAAEIRDFPDGESYVRIDSNVQNKTILLICSLDHPNNKILPLVFMAKTLKELGAHKIHLISPYLAYMRQDKRFHPGEAVNSTLFAQLLSDFVDSIMTIDPHLHRIHNLSEIFTIPCATLHAKKIIATWIRNQVDAPVIIGPDEESRQWVEEVAKDANAPFIVAEKIRHGDRDVRVSIPTFDDLSKTPVLVDDIISTGVSMIESIQELKARGFKNPICIAVHALFDQNVYEHLRNVGAQEIISCNTIPHFSNKIDISDVIAEEIKNVF
ncbi:MAG: ribose-phosphate pyrophosphokinase [Proteobacteria bacterium]|nr:ribose-phosphate pyrophosphokinase [Pseudomonadota bacterium]